MDNNYKLDFSIIPKELRLILEIIKGEKEDNIILKKDLFKDTDWELFLQLAIHHRVYPLLYSKLKKVSEGWIPKYVIENLYQEYKKNTFQMLLLSGEMEQISRLFDENQIRLLLLKGPVIAHDIYGDISLRTSKDLDILIEKADIKIVEELLLNYGYEREEIPDNFHKWSNHHITYYHPQKKIEIEIHWRLNSPPSKEPSFDDLWERKRISTLTTHQVYLLGEEDLLLFLIAHGSRHGWFRLRWLVDIDQILHKRINLSKNNLSIKKYQHDHLGEKANLLIEQAFILAAELLNNPIKRIHPLAKGKHIRMLTHRTINYIIEKGHIETTGANYNKNQPLSIKKNIKSAFNIIYYEFLIKSNIHKVIFVLKLFKPSSADIKLLRLPKLLYFLYVPLRPFLWIWRKKKAYTN